MLEGEEEMAIIGISCGFKDTREQNIVLNNDYINAVKKTGGIPIIIPPHLEIEALKSFKNKLDGLILSGGGDIDPFFFGEEPNFNINRIDPIRDKIEIELVKWSIKEKIPLLAICRGIQIINIACGGTIIQDLNQKNDKNQNHLKHQQQAPRRYPTHTVYLKKNSVFSDIFKAEEIKVNSFHHQAIKEPGDNLEITGRAADKVIEGIALNNHPFGIGVQWHPERMFDHYPEQRNLFKQFINKCK